MLTQILEKGIDKPTGYVLPLKMDIESNQWKSSVWKFNRNKLFLIPGNSAIGYRLPLDRLLDKKVETSDIVVHEDHLQQSATLVDQKSLESLVNNRLNEFVDSSEKRDNTDESSMIRHSLCVELKNGNLHIFLPPLDEINQFLELIYCIDRTAAELDIKVIIDGYQAPYHNDIVRLGVTPDPGVIEVNVHPAKSWDELLYIYDNLFEATQKVGLSTNKFMLDGKHTGTGGGNHITLGGETPADSPLLRRPDLLRSMLTFWQNHPGLSYLFSSQFIGPTSQAPRIDEGRPDNIYELEIAFSELAKYDDPPFWLVDRVFRNLLTDLTGNTHRSEFCIDKLYNPESMTGRLGILELRGFDMPPNKEMCLVQLLLIRSLIAVFWKNPYVAKLINWGTDLHNKFMMHHFIKEDMYDVVDLLNAHNIPFKKEWLHIFLDFRFPLYGKVNISGINLSIRAGIEPWIVLGEEMSGTGTSRYVDSSLERIEVLLEDFNPDRYMLLCNYYKVPVMLTSYKGKYVAAVRYKAWDPHSALHPTIGVNSPLVFDIYDSWNDRSVGGCTYHVMHPGGRSYDTFPVNSLEAESRRMTRFWEFNHSPKNNSAITNQRKNTKYANNYVTFNDDFKEDIVIKYIPSSHEFPHTLDLRRG